MGRYSLPSGEMLAMRLLSADNEPVVKQARLSGVRDYHIIHVLQVSLQVSTKTATATGIH